MKTLLANWKTSSAGLLMIGSSIAHLIFNRPITEAAFNSALVAIIGGIGLIAAGDARPTQPPEPPKPNP